MILPEIPTSCFENHICEWISEMFNENNESFDFVYVLSHRFASIMMFGQRVLTNGQLPMRNTNYFLLWQE